MSEQNLSAVQRSRIECNRQRALMLRNARLTSRPYPESGHRRERAGTTAAIFGESATSCRLVDTGGGFLLDTEENEEVTGVTKNFVEEPGPILGADQHCCLECEKDFSDSVLFSSFDALVCDQCRDKDGKHALITKTEAKQSYMLKDCDMDRREPPLKFLLRKNPHHSRGEMKLYLKAQIIMRSYEVWGSEEELEKAREEKEEKREIQKQNKFDKKVKELRRAVRTSTWKKNTGRHVHVYPAQEGGDVYDEHTDTWTKTCIGCGYELTYEKM